MVTPLVLVLVLTLLSHSGSSATGKGFRTTDLLEPARAEGQALSQPHGIAVQEDRRLFVADTSRHRIAIIDLTTGMIEFLGEVGQGPGQFRFPKDVALDGQGNLYVADTGNHRIQKLDPSGRLLLQVGDPDVRKGELDSPGGVAIGPDGSIYVADTGNRRIVKYDPAGRQLFSIGPSLANEEELIGPTRLALGPDQVLYATDSDNQRLHAFSPEGLHLFAFGTAGTRAGQFKKPMGLAVAPDGTLLVADHMNGRIQKFSAQGEFLAEFRLSPSDEQGANFPNGIALDSKGALYATDSIRNRVTLLEFQPALMLLEEGWTKFEAKRYEDALDVWSRVLELDPSVAEAWFGIGLIYLASGRLTLAIEQFDQALRLQPDYHQAIVARRKALARRYRPLVITPVVVGASAAGYLLLRARKARALKRQAQDHLQRGETRASMAAFERYLEVQRRDVEVRQILSNLYEESGMVEKTHEVNESIARLDPDNLKALSYLGKTQFRKGDFAQAAKTWQKAAGLDCHRSDFRFFLGVALAQLGRSEEALQQFHEALSLESDDPMVLIRAAESLAQGDETRRARRKVRELPEEPHIGYRLSRLLDRLRQGLSDEQDADAGEPGVASSMALAVAEWSDFLAGRRELAGALTLFQEARTQTVARWLAEAKRQLEEGQEQKARSLIRGAREVDPESSEVLELVKETEVRFSLARGLEAYKSQHYSEAIEAFKETLLSDPENQEARRYLLYAEQMLEGGFRNRFRHLDMGDADGA